MRRPPSPFTLRAVLGWTAAVAALGGVFMLYQRPELAFTLASQLWAACF